MKKLPSLHGSAYYTVVRYRVPNACHKVYKGWRVGGYLIKQSFTEVCFGMAQSLNLLECLVKQCLLGSDKIPRYGKRVFVMLLA